MHARARMTSAQRPPDQQQLAVQQADLHRRLQHHNHPTREWSHHHNHPRHNHAAAAPAAPAPPPAAPAPAIAPPPASPRAPPSTTTPATGARFRVLTWNILADRYARQHGKWLYRDVHPRHLEWRARLAACVDEVGRAGLPDVLCLQEVDRFDDVARELAGLGYRGAFLRRTGARDDGCATFWRHGGGGGGGSSGGGGGGGDAAPPPPRLAPVRVRPVRFEDYGLKDNVALLVEFEVQCGPLGGAGTGGGAGPAAAAPTTPTPTTTPTRRLVVANTHLMFTKDRGDIKVGQTRVLLEAVAAMAAGGEPPAPPTAAALGAGASPASGAGGGRSAASSLASAAAAALRAASLTFGAGFRTVTGAGATPPPPLVMSPAADGGGLPTPEGPTPAATAQPLRPRQALLEQEQQQQHEHEQQHKAAVLVACDLNAVPGSALYSLMTKGELDLGGRVPRRSVSGQNDARGVGGFAARARGGSGSISATTSSSSDASANGNGNGVSSSSPAFTSSSKPSSSAPAKDAAPQPWTDREILRATGLPPQELRRAAAAAVAAVAAAGAKGDGDGDGDGGSGPLTMRHSLAGQLRSTYADVDGREPPFTSAHLEFMDACDYIFYTPGGGGGAAGAGGGAAGEGDGAPPPAWRLQPVSVLRAPSGEALPRGLPAEGYGSDHVALVADYILEAL
jgi:hypothetical protein